MDQNIPLISAITISITSIVGSIVAFYTANNGRKRNTFEMYSDLYDDIGAMNEKLMDNVRRLEVQLEGLEEKNLKRKQEVIALSLELSQARERIASLEYENTQLRIDNEKLLSILESKQNKD